MGNDEPKKSQQSGVKVPGSEFLALQVLFGAIARPMAQRLDV